MVFGEITTAAKLDYDKIVRNEARRARRAQPTPSPPPPPAPHRAKATAALKLDGRGRCRGMGLPAHLSLARPLPRAQVKKIGFDSFVDDLSSVDSKGESLHQTVVNDIINKQGT